MERITTALPMISHFKFDYVVGIDPDVERNGIGILHVATREVEIKELPFAQTFDYLLHLRGELRDKQGMTLVVVVEASWLTQGNWHLKWGDNRRISSAKGYSVGRNHQVGHDIVDLCKMAGIEVIEKQPLRKCWKGKDGKITREELEAFTHVKGRNNQEGRDALLLAWDYACLPIRLKI